MDKQITCSYCLQQMLLSDAIDLEFEIYNDQFLYFCNMSCLNRFKLNRDSKVSRTLFKDHKCVNCFKVILDEDLIYFDQIGNRKLFFCDIACHIVFEDKGFQMLD